MSHPLEALMSSSSAAPVVVTDDDYRQRVLGIHRFIETKLLDYKHFELGRILNCIDMLTKVIGNVIDNPGEDKYKQVNRLKLESKLGEQAGVGEELLIKLGFHVQVVEHKAKLVFRAEHGEAAHWRLLQETLSYLEKSREVVEGKQERRLKDPQLNRAAAELERKRVLAAVEDDRRERHLRQQPVSPSTPTAIQQGHIVRNGNALPPSPPTFPTDS